MSRDYPRSQFVHTDNLLGLRRPDKVAEAQEKANAKEVAQTLDQWAAEVNVLHTLMQSEGWALMKEAFANEAAIVRARMAECIEPTTLAKGVGALLMLEGFQSWPQDAINNRLRALDEAKSQG